MNPPKKSKSTTNNFEVAFENKTGRRVAHGFNGEVQFNGVQYGSAEHNKLALQYNKERSNNINDKNWKVAKGVGKVLDPTGISSWGDVSRAFSKEGDYFDKATSLVSAIPILGNVEKGGIRLVKGITDAEKALNTVQKIEKIVDKGNDLVSIKKLDDYVAKKTGKVLDKVFPIKRTTTMAEANKRAKINLSTSIINTTNKITDISDLAPSFKNMYDGYAQSKATIDNKKKETNTKNLAIENTTKKYAMGGSLRPSSRKRAIVPVAAIGLGLQAVSSVMGIFGADKAKREAKSAQNRAEQAAINNQYLNQKAANAVAFNEANEYGQDGVQYYATGGDIKQDLSDESNLSDVQKGILQRSIAQTNAVGANAPVSASGFQTKGGYLKQIGDGVEEVVGNKHNDTTIDGVSGVQLHANGELKAEVERKEIITDGTNVYSQQLKYDKKNTYADKIRQIVKQRNKLEAKQENASSKREKNTIERQLAGLNMAENAVFEHQESYKYANGIKAANKFAAGGRLSGDPRKPRYKTDFGSPIVDGKYKGWKKNSDGDMMHPTDKNVVISKDGIPKYDIDTNATGKASSAAVAVNPMNTATSTVAGRIGIQTATEQLAPKQVINTIPPPKVLGIAEPPNASISGPVSGTPPVADAKGTGFDYAKLAPMVIDNIGNLILGSNTPKLATPLMAKPESLETRVNINPQLAEVRRSNKSMKDTILKNTSNSNNAKINSIATDLNRTKQENDLLGAKDNQEVALRNANAQNVQQVQNQNTATANQHSMNQYQRANDINTKLSANLANLQGDIKTVMQMGEAKDNFDGYTNANLADDPDGEKAYLYMTNPRFMKDPNNRATIMAKIEELDADGKYKNIGLRNNAIKAGLITK